MLTSKSFALARRAALSAALTVLVSACAAPQKPLNVADTIAQTPSLSTLSGLITSAGLTADLQSAGPFTVFAPTDAAFAKIPKADLDALLKDKAALTKVLTYHVVPGKVMAKDVKAGNVKTVQGGNLTLATMGGVTVNGAKVVAADVAADNGVIHAVDTVIMPK